MAREKTAMGFAIAAGFLLLISGTSGLATWQTIKEFVLTFIIDNLYVQYGFAFLILIASLGGLSVIIGGLLIGAKRVTTGKIIIGIGAGMGLLGFLISLLIAIAQESLVFGEYLTVGFVGIVLSMIARSIPRKEKED